MLPGDDFFALKNFAKGKISKYDLMDAIPFIKDVKLNRENFAKSEIILEFEDYKSFLEFLGVPEDDAWFAQAVNSYYGDFEFNDSYSAHDDFEQGYGVWYVMDEDNVKLLEKIAKLIHPEEFDLNDDEYKSNLAEKLNKFFPKEIDDIVSDYTYERNSEMTKTARDYISNEVIDAVSSKGFELYNDGLKASVAKLISLFLQYNIPHASLKELIKEIFQNNNLNLGGWDENRYEYQDDDNFDKDSINRTINRNFETIYDKLVDDDVLGDGRKFIELINRITNKFKVGVWYNIPKDPKFVFRIKSFNRENLKINLDLKKPKGEIKNIEVSEENLNNLLYQPELFKFGEF